MFILGFPTTQNNGDLLHEEMALEFGENFLGLSTNPRSLFIHFSNEVDEDIVEQVIDDHDHLGLTVLQSKLARSNGAKDRALAIPNWATWTETETVNYIENNVTDLASAKVVLVAMARLLVALRQDTWPDLG